MSKKSRACVYTFPEGVLHYDKRRGCQLGLGPYPAWDYGFVVVVKFPGLDGMKADYSITHKASGLGIATEFLSQRKAQLCAAVVTALPMPWEGMPDELQAAWYKAPKWAQDLLIAIHRGRQ